MNSQVAWLVARCGAQSLNSGPWIRRFCLCFTAGFRLHGQLLQWNGAGSERVVSIGVSLKICH